jgi:hypothetical protein
MHATLTRDQEVLHKKALGLCRQYRELEWPIIETLREVDRSKLYLKFEVTSLFQYALQILGLSEAVAYSFITLGRKAAEVPELKIALQAKVVSAGKASRIVAVINRKNAGELIEFAAKRTRREVDHKVAELNPKLAVRESAKPIAKDIFELRTGISKQAFDLLQRSQALIAQKKGRNPSLAETLEVVLAEFVKRQDPVQKAERAKGRLESKALCKAETSAERQGPQLCLDRVAKAIHKRQPLSAEQRHKVFSRDGGRCSHVDSNGHLCSNDRWIHIHHIRPVSAGGSNEPGNLTTLCSVHHDLVHQLSLPLEGQVTWLRSPMGRYTAGKSMRAKHI